MTYYFFGVLGGYQPVADKINMAMIYTNILHRLLPLLSWCSFVKYSSIINMVLLQFSLLHGYFLLEYLNRTGFYS